MDSNIDQRRLGSKYRKKVSEPINIGILTRNAIHGGVESLIHIEQEKFGAQVIVAGGLDDPEGTCPFHYHYINNIEELLEKLTTFDAIIYHWINDWAVQAIDYLGVPSIEIVHRTDTDQCDKTVPTLIGTHSNYIKEHIKQKYNRDSIIIPNVVDTNRFSSKQSWNNKIGKICLITSYYSTKGIDIFLHAWKLVQERYPNCIVDIYGKGDEKDLFINLARELGVKVNFNGPTSNPEDIMLEYDLYVTASRIEGLPVSLLEALSCDIPIVASKIEGHEIINQLAREQSLQEPLFLFESENVQDLASLLCEFISGGITYIPGTGRTLIEALFSSEKHTNVIDEHIRNIVLNSKRPKKKIQKNAQCNMENIMRSSGQNGFFYKKVSNNKIFEHTKAGEKLISTYDDFLCYEYYSNQSQVFISFEMTCELQEQQYIFVQLDVFSKQGEHISNYGEGQYVNTEHNILSVVWNPRNKLAASKFILIVRPNNGSTVTINNVKITEYK